MTARAFDVCGELPRGITVLEASAGTGKTYAIAALAARYVAEGVPLDELLLVSFTRMATGELRERVRERLVSAEHALGLVLAGAPPSSADDVVRLLASGPEADVRVRRDRLARAVADFDAATITTTHGFCHEVLGGLGVAGDVDPATTLVEDAEDLLEEVVDDLYVRRFHRRDIPPFDRSEALAIARLAVANPLEPIEPEAAPEESIAAMRVRLARAVRDEIAARKRRMAIMTFDDVLTQLDATLGGPMGDATAERLRSRYRVVLIDEFQDTDPVQWRIVRRAFGADGTTVVLIGDPKQAIYAFRGADVYAYLDAAQTAGAQHTLNVNWRSDEGLIRAYDALFGGARLGHERIVHRPVEAAPAHRAPRLSGAPSVTPLRIRVVDRDAPSMERTAYGYARKPAALAHIVADLADDVVALLSSGAEIEDRAEDGTALARHTVRPRHIAVLVPTHRHAAAVRDALDAAEVPAVIAGAGTVFATEPAREWLRLLEALERPASDVRARTAALTAFIGWSAEEVACAGEDELEALHRRLHDWAGILRARGVASLTTAITNAEQLPRRILGAVDGERQLTDLRHVGQLLHAAATTEALGVTSLTAWLRRRIATAADETPDEDRTRRLESDAEAVQVLTIHGSKGLEFPIVYCPFLWEPGYIPEGARPVVFHDPDADDRRTLDVGLDGPDFGRHQDQHRIEERGEDLRLAYVALTRARHQAVIWWAGSFDSRDSALGRLLFARADDGTIAPKGRRVPTDAQAIARFEELAAAAPGCIAVEPIALGLPAAWGGEPAAPADLCAARFDRALDSRWRRTSYSDIAAGAHEPRVASEPEEDTIADEPAEAPPTAPAAPDDALSSTPSPLGAVPGGTDVGTLVHRVLEATDFTAGDLDAEIAGHLRAAQGRRQVDAGDAATLVAGLRAAVETPLGPLVGGIRLRDVARADRLDELAFELPLAGGDRPSGRVTLSAVADVLRERLARDDPLAPYADRLGDPALRQAVRGYLAGSIDLVVRTRDGGEPRFAVVDHKTNRLAPAGTPLTAWHHRPAALVAEMQRAHYVLQALLYLVALHRYLRWRLPGYDPDRNLAGVLYLFLRGMTGAATPVVDGTPVGVFAWRPPSGLVAALSDVLDGARAT